MSSQREAFPRICIIGAGYAGICAGVQLKRTSKIHNFTIIEQNRDFGGVWLSNSYPGCASDIVSHLYCLSFEPNPTWSSSLAPQPEILSYLQGIAAKYDLYSNALFKHSVSKAVWDTNSGKWIVHVTNESTGDKKELVFDIVINGQGRFSSPQVPEVFRDFKGIIIHTSEWNDSVEYRGKRVAVVGTGSTGVQIIPSIAKDVKSLVVFQRHAPWVFPVKVVQYSPLVQWAFASIPGVHRLYRYFVHWTYYEPLYYLNWRHKTKLHQKASAFANSYREKEVPDEILRSKLTPNYPLGCKRVTPSTKWYPTFNLPHVKVVTSKIQSVLGSSFITEDGTVEDIDVLILATGFKVQDHYGSFEVIGKDGQDLRKTWANDIPKSYMGTVSSVAPNYFFLLGPNTAPGYTSVLFQLECQVNWMLQVIQKMISLEKTFVCVKSTAMETYMKEIKENLDKTSYTDPGCGKCQSWLQSSKGFVSEIYPGTTFSFWKRTLKVKQDDFILA